MWLYFNICSWIRTPASTQPACWGHTLSSRLHHALLHYSLVVHWPEIEQAPHHFIFPSIFCGTQLMPNQGQRGQITVVASANVESLSNLMKDLSWDLSLNSTTEDSDSRQTQMWTNHHIWTLNKRQQWNVATYSTSAASAHRLDPSEGEGDPSWSYNRLPLKTTWWQDRKQRKKLNASRFLLSHLRASPPLCDSPQVWFENLWKTGAHLPLL